jgi:hypothetical protein
MLPVYARSLVADVIWAPMLNLLCYRHVPDAQNLPYAIAVFHYRPGARMAVGCIRHSSGTLIGDVTASNPCLHHVRGHPTSRTPFPPDA